MTHPLEITGVDEDGVTSPVNDGSAGSGLYAVPIKLNRAPSAREAALLVLHWDHPSQFSTMHRAGIAQVVGDRLVLTKTTIDEVHKHHAATVRLAVEATNRDEQTAARQDQATNDAAAEAQDAHRAHVAEVSEDITF